MPRLDIAVAGAGIGGLATALLLARQGHRVVVVERFATPRPLGSGLILQPTGLGVLDALGLSERIRAHGAPIRRLYGVSNGRVSLDVRYAALGREGLAVHRSALFGMLFGSSLGEPGVSIESGFEVSGLDRAAGSRPVLVSIDGRSLGAFDLVVDAAGARSALSAGAPDRRRALAYGALWTTIPWPGAPFAVDALEQRYEKASKMVGLLPIGRLLDDPAPLASFFWSVKPKNHAAWLARGLEAWKDEVRALWPEVSPALDTIRHADDLVLASYSHHTLNRPYGDRFVSIGDAAHATSPQLGQGANMALLDAVALGRAVADGANIDDAPKRYAAARWTHVRLYQTISRLFTPVYQSDSRVLPLLRDRLFAPASRAPGAGKLLAKLVSGEIGLPSER